MRVILGPNVRMKMESNSYMGTMAFSIFPASFVVKISKVIGK
jgi:hypothetical protein